MSAPPTTTMTAPSGAEAMLLPELLGYIPQFFLDDLFGVAQEAVNHTVVAMEKYLSRWAENRMRTAPDKSRDAEEEVEQGLVSFQTLLESHVDFAFDILESWTLTNILFIPHNLPVVAPHQRGLDLNQPDAREMELLAEVEDLRRRIDNERKVERVFKRAVRRSAQQLKSSQTRLDTLSFMRDPHALSDLSSLPTPLDDLRASAHDLPSLDELPSAPVGFQSLAPGGGKRQWEVGREGYERWAMSQLLSKARADAGDKAGVAAMVMKAEDIGTADDFKAALGQKAETLEDDSMDET